MAHQQHYLALCCIAKDETPFIAEWLTYHSLIGVEHFFIYDNFSAIPLEEHPLVQKLVAQGRATVASIAGKTMQLPAYAYCLQTYGPQCKWIAFIDLDEFICPLHTSDVRTLLSEYEDYAGLALNWKCFGSAGHLSRPAGLVMQSYQERFPRLHPMNFHVKSIVQPAKTANVHNAHAFYPHQGQVMVNEQFRPLPFGGPLSPVSWEKACINHYVLKSQQDVEHRIQRGRADIPSDEPTIGYERFYSLVREPQEADSAITRFIPQVAQLLEAGAAHKLFMPEPGDPSDPQSYIDLATSFMLAKEPEKAEVTLCRAVLRFADKPLIWLTRALVARKKREYQKARAFAYKALALAELPQTYLELIHLNIDEGDKEEALNLLYYLRHTAAIRVQDEGFYAELDKLAASLSNAKPSFPQHHGKMSHQNR